MANPCADLIWDQASYTPAMIANLLDVSEEWARTLIVNQIRHRKIGNQILVSGFAFRLWLEHGESPGGNPGKVDDITHPEA